MARNSHTLSYLPDNRDELQKLSEHLTTGGSVVGLKEEWVDIWERIQVADRIIRNYTSSKAQLEKLRAHELFASMSRTQLWRYRDAVQEIYGATEKGNKRYKRLIAEQMIHKGLKLAKKNDDGRLFAAMIKQYCTIHGLDNHDEDDTKPLEPQANLMVVVVDGEAKQFDLNNPEDIPEEVRAVVVETIFHSQTPKEPTFLDAK